MDHKEFEQFVATWDKENSWTRREFHEYLARFELIVVQGIKAGRWGMWRDVSIRDTKITGTPLGMYMGSRFLWDSPAAIEYFGHVRKSTGFMSVAVDLTAIHVKTINCLFVNFSVVHIEDLSKLCEELVPGFPTFKTIIKKLRFNA